jgi:hypothetical protein
VAQVDAQHIPVLTSGFVGLLVLSLLGIAALNWAANK